MSYPSGLSTRYFAVSSTDLFDERGFMAWQYCICGGWIDEPVAWLRPWIYYRGLSIYRYLAVLVGPPNPKSESKVRHHSTQQLLYVNLKCLSLKSLFQKVAIIACILWTVG